MDDFLLRCREAAEILSKKEKITVIGHRDADGICAAVIVKRCYSEKEVVIRIIRHSTDLARLKADCGDSFPVFVDYGSSEIAGIESAFGDFLILDHHPPERSHPKMVNPWDFGIDGTRQLSGAGVSYFVAREEDPANISLSSIALIGAMGDKMHLSGFNGPNALLMDDALRAGLISFKSDDDGILVGRLPFSSEPLPALLVADIIDSCASVNRPELAVGMLMGDLDSYKSALGVHEEYERLFNDQLQAIRSGWNEIMERNSQYLAYFIYLPEIQPGFTGPLAEEIVLEVRDKPIVIISSTHYGLKASGRATKEQVETLGLDLGRALSSAAQECGGRGGGHDIAAGASFREEDLERFKGLVTMGLFRQWRSRLKVLLDVETRSQSDASSLASSLAVDNERYRSTNSIALSLDNKLYIIVLSEDIGTFKNTVDDLIVCLTSSKDILNISKLD